MARPSMTQDDFPSGAISEFLRRMNRETSLAVAAAPRTGRAPGAWSLLAPPFLAFLRAYVARGGFRRGAGGFVRSVLDAIAELVLRAKRWERGAVAGVREPAPEDPADIGAMERRYAP